MAGEAGKPLSWRGARWVLPAFFRLGDANSFEWPAQPHRSLKGPRDARHEQSGLGGVCRIGRFLSRGSDRLSEMFRGVPRLHCMAFSVKLP